MKVTVNVARPSVRALAVLRVLANGGWIKRNIRGGWDMFGGQAMADPVHPATIAALKQRDCIITDDGREYGISNVGLAVVGACRP